MNSTNRAEACYGKSEAVVGSANKRKANSCSQRPPSAELRTRGHLAPTEVEALIEAAGKNRQGRRDALMVLLAYRHGLRAAEVVDLRWEQVDFKSASQHVRRVKNGTPSAHPLTGRELRRHQRESAKSPSVFVSERGAPLSASGFSRISSVRR